MDRQLLFKHLDVPRFAFSLSLEHWNWPRLLLLQLSGLGRCAESGCGLVMGRGRWDTDLLLHVMC